MNKKSFYRSNQEEHSYATVSHKLSVKEKEPIFVVQEHHTSHLHYDFRLEVDGVLKSWAVPKGPPLVKGIKRLALAVKDHPLEHAFFEGIIPAGEYGAGRVLLWDSGTYKNLTKEDGLPISMQLAIKNGHIKIELKGALLTGIYILIKSSYGKNNSWFLIKLD